MHGMKNKLEIYKGLKKNYFKCPNKIFDIGIHIQCVGFYCFLLSLPEDFNPSITYLTNKLKISRNTVLRYMEYLESLGMVRKTEKGSNLKRRVSKYELLSPKNWKM